MNRIAKMLVMDDKKGRDKRDGRDWSDRENGRSYRDAEYEYRRRIDRDRDRHDMGRDSREVPDYWPGRDPMHRYDFSLHGAMTHKDGWRRSGGMTFDRGTAKDWTDKMQNEDGSRGPHWNREQTDQVLTQKGFDCDPDEFFAILNSVYSDYSAVAKKHGVNNIDFYADLAKSWLCDKDAVKDKAAAYFEYVVKH